MSNKADSPGGSGRIVFGDNLTFLRSVDSNSVDLIYIDPPFNTGKVQTRKKLQVTRDEATPDRIGFQGNGYRTQMLEQRAFNDEFENFEAFILPRLDEAYRVLKPNGSFFLHIDYREVHYCKIYLDQIFGRDSFMNEIIWAYDYGARSKKRWSAKHENILWYAKTPAQYTFNYDEMDRIPYMAPDLVGPEKAARGKTPSDTWWHTIVPTNGKEKTGYPTQKPLGIIERIIRIHSNPGDLVMDFFAGSGTVGEACGKLGRNFVMVDENAEAIDVMKTRLARFNPEEESMDLQMNPNPPKPVFDISNVHIIVAAVWDYQDPALQGLQGPEQDAAKMQEIFSKDSPIGLFDPKQIDVFLNPTVNELREAFVNYAYERSAKGDILIFYFSGHGAAIGTDFGFCLKDTRLRPDGGGFLPLSLLPFSHVLATLQTADVHPVFIIDACFSGKAASQDQTSIITAMEDNIKSVAGGSYALFCASYEYGLAIDWASGGAFTSALHDASLAGLGDKHQRKLAHLELEDLQAPVRQSLTVQGAPISRLFTGAQLPRFPLIQNAAHQPITEKMQPYQRKTLDLMWNEGKPRTVSPKEILDNCGTGAYGNHNKLTYGPWHLVESDKKSKERGLTDRGVEFVQGSLSIPSEIMRDPTTNEWIPVPDAPMVTYADVRPKRQRSVQK